jgi:hypothetical protein
MSDIIFDNSEQITVACDNLNVQGHDFLLDSAKRRKAGHASGFRRALVHDQNDGLTFNFGNDYPGGVTISDVKALDITGSLKFRISHHDSVLLSGKNPPDETVVLSDVIKTLREQIAALQTEVTKLAARP